MSSILFTLIHLSIVSFCLSTCFWWLSNCFFNSHFSYVITKNNILFIQNNPIMENNNQIKDRASARLHLSPLVTINIFMNTTMIQTQIYFKMSLNIQTNYWILMRLTASRVDMMASLRDRSLADLASSACRSCCVISVCNNNNNTL